MTNLLSVFSSILLSLHVPQEFSRVLWHFLRHGETTTCEVTDRRKRGKATFAALVRFVLCTG